MNKKGQSEMMGFALILIIVMVIILVFISISLNKKTAKVQSVALQGFIQSTLQYTTNCALGYSTNYQNIRNVIFMCLNNESCYSNGGSKVSSCSVLNSTMSNLLNDSWHVGKDWPNKGYNLVILGKELPTFNFSKGIVTQNSSGATQVFPNAAIDFTVYT